MKQYNESIRGKLFEYFEKRLSVKPSTGGWYRSDCFYCGGKFTMGINLLKSYVHCFKCGEKVNPIQLLMDMEGFEEFVQARNFLNLAAEYEKYQDFKSDKKVEKKQISLPPGFHSIDDVEDRIGKSAQRYLRKRGFSIKKLATLGVGYCNSGEYLGYIVWPYYQNGNLVFFQGRKFMDLGPKMKNPEKGQFGVGKTEVIYNIDALFIYNICYIVESITNANTLGDRACATSGKTFSRWQFNVFYKAPCKGYIFLLDEDAYDIAIKQAMQLVHHKRVKVVQMPKDKDVNDLGKKKTLKLIKSTPWQTYSDLLRIKIKLDEKNPKFTYHGRGPYYNPSRGF